MTPARGARGQLVGILVGATLGCVAATGAACFTSSRAPSGGDASDTDAATADGAGESASGLDASCVRVLPDCPSAPPSYNGTIAAMVQDRCGGCHFPGSTIARGDFSAYAAVYADRGSILDQVYGCLMPPAGSTPLTPDERTELLTWLVCGAPNN